ncbi:hypothetical protein MPTK1_5g13050 [Marchantia polymorpha subsp. ruderalis]
MLSIGKRRLYPASKFTLYIAADHAIKLPIILFHTWLPDTHGEAHYSTCMLLAGIFLKEVDYGLVRINMDLIWNCFFMHIHFFSMVRSHMKFIFIEIGSITNLGLNGAILQINQHGLTYDQTSTSFLDEMSGIGNSMLKIFTLLTSCSMASLALPGLSGFMAELITSVVIDSIDPNYFSTRFYLLSLLRQMFYGLLFSNT